MIGLVAAPGTKTVTIGGQQVTVPDIKLPAAVSRSWSLTDHGIPVVRLTYNGEKHTVLLYAIGQLGGENVFIIDGPLKLLAFLRSRLGSDKVSRLLPALRAKQALRLRVAALGFTRVYNEAGTKVINVQAPLVICGNAGLDWIDGEEPEDAVELGNL